MSEAAPSRPVSRPPALVDAHVHLYSVYDRERFLHAAWTNFERARRSLGLSQATYVMCFTEDARHNAFAELASFRSVGSIEIRPTQDEAALSVRFDSEPHTGRTEPERAASSNHDAVGNHSQDLYLIAGRQIITSEGLELLALATRDVIPDGVSLSDGIARVRAAGGVPVVPWAFGKWWGRRGVLVRAALASGHPPDLGDNSARASMLLAPAFFRQAESRGRAVLPGTDPLPLRGHQGRAGSYGFVLDHGLSSDHPARDLVVAIQAMSTSPARFGRRVGPFEFVRDQIALRLRKRPISGTTGR
jgi:hypothetical protein